MRTTTRVLLMFAATTFGVPLSAQSGPIERSESPGDRETSDSVADVEPGSLSMAKEDQTDRAVMGPLTADTSKRRAGVMEEVIVTATKREAFVEDIPLSIAVVQNQDIERRAPVGMEDYLRAIPGVNQIDRGSAENSIVVRGITTSPSAAENISSGPTVGSYFGETSITSAGSMAGAGIDVRPVDIERIEVLRGPQGSAYGSASLSGTVRVIPAMPKLDDLSARIVGSLSTTESHGSENSMVQGVVNVPIVQDRLGLRGVAYRYEESGFYENVAGNDFRTITFAERFGLGDYVRGFTQDDVGGFVSSGGRLGVLWKAGEKLDLSLNLLTQKTEQDGSPVADVGRFEQARVPVAPQGRVRGKPGTVADPEIDLINLVLDYDLGWAQLTSAASWIDSGTVISSVFGPTFVPFFGPASSTVDGDFKSFTTEIRLASDFQGPLQFLGGVFYEDLKDHVHQTWDWPGDPTLNPLRTSPMGIGDIDRRLDQRAVFGEVTYNVTQKLSATVGGRYFKYKKDEATVREGGIFGTPIGTSRSQALVGDEDGSTLKASINYKPSSDSLVYASWAEGFRLGRPAVGVSALCDRNADGLIDGTSVSMQSTRSIDSDYLENYEIGSKFALFERRITLDAAVFHIKWDGLPILQQVISPSCTDSYTANVGAATSKGVELQARFYAAEGVRIDLGAGYTKAELSRAAPSLNARDGARLPGSPEVSANLSIQYEFKVGTFDAFIRGDSIYAGRFYGNLQESPGTAAGDYVKLDARLGATIDSFSVELFARNITNEDAFTWRSQGPTANDPSTGYRLRPRTIGIQLGYDFD